MLKVDAMNLCIFRRTGFRENTYHPPPQHSISLQFSFELYFSLNNGYTLTMWWKHQAMPRYSYYKYLPTHIFSLIRVKICRQGCCTFDLYAEPSSWRHSKHTVRYNFCLHVRQHSAISEGLLPWKFIYCRSLYSSFRMLSNWLFLKLWVKKYWAIIQSFHLNIFFLIKQKDRSIIKLCKQ